MLDAHPERIETARKILPLAREQGPRAENEPRLPREVIRARTEAPQPLFGLVAL